MMMWSLLLIVLVIIILGFAFILLAMWLVARTASRQPKARRRERRPKVACPQCGERLPGDAPEGLCPACLLQGAIESVHASPSALNPVATSPYTPTNAASGAAPSVDELGRRLPHLEILEILGQGGMGAVYKARQPALDRHVAVKVLPPDAGRDPAFALRFQGEAKTLARLSHPHIVGVHEVGQAEDLYYFVMEFVDGVNLRQLLSQGLLRPEQALRIVPQICDALQYAHEQGVVHRDIKPENILLDRNGRVKIADFGLAKLLGFESSGVALTGSRQVMGTLYYMAPEQMDQPHSVDHRADIYSLGVVFYEMLTGELPVGRFPPPSDKAGTEAYLDAVVFRALERRPERRYQRAEEVKTDVQSGRSPSPAPPSNPTASGSSDRLTVALAREQLRTPAFGLMLCPFFGVIGYIVAALICLLTYVSHDIPSPDDWLVGFFISLGLLFLGFVGGGVIYAGAQSMRHLRSYEFSYITTLVAFVPPMTGIGYPLSLIFGGWALRLLHKPEIKAAFAVELRSRAEAAVEQAAHR